MSKTLILCHIVFTTRLRHPTLNPDSKTELYAYINGILKKLDCKLLRINGMPDHIHLLIDLHPTVALSTVMREIKASSSTWLKKNPTFPLFKGWGEGYFAGTLRNKDKNACISYINNQETHHLQKDFLDEILNFTQINELDFREDEWV